MKENLINYGYKTIEDEDEFEMKNNERKEIAIKAKKSVPYSGSSLLLLLQIAVCVVIILFVLLLKSISDPWYQTFRAWYVEKVNDSLILGDSNDDYVDAINNIISRDYKASLFSNITENRQTTRGVSKMPVTLTSAPCKPIGNGVITSEFGERTDPFNSNSRDTHYGLDIGAEEGSEIYAAFSGVIEVSESNDSYGNYILIDHGKDIKTLYAHCNQLLKSEGDKVTKGEKIALVGCTGQSTGNHLHFEVIISNERYDPAPLLKGIYA